jgi:predicted dehydrogenase
MTLINRRQFTSLAAATAAGAAIAPRSVFSQETSPNDKIGVAVVGVNGRGGEHIREFIGDKRTEIRALVDIDEYVANKKADSIAEMQGKRPTVYADMRKAFDSPDIDAISTATPNHWHALCGIWAMQAGKDVYIEKPISHNITEGRALIEAAKKYKRIAQTGTQCRSSGAIRPAVEFLQSGGIGEVKLARGLCYKRRKSIGALGDYPVPPSVNFDLWSGPATFTTPKVTRKQFHYDWHWQRHYGNGDLGNQGPHQTDIARWGLGLMRHPNTIISYGGRLGYQAERDDPNYVDAGDTANTCVSIYDYGDKCIVFETRGLDVDDSKDEEINKLMGYSRGNKVGVIFYGTDGYLVQESYGRCMVYDKEFKMIKEFKGGTPHFKNFVDACISRKESDLNASMLEGHLSAGISHLGNISYYLGEDNRVDTKEIAKVLSSLKAYDDHQATLARTVQHLTDNKVDLEKYPISLGPLLAFDNETEKFKGNSAADALLTREYRRGFEVPSIENL